MFKEAEMSYDLLAAEAGKSVKQFEDRRPMPELNSEEDNKFSLPLFVLDEAHPHWERPFTLLAYQFK